jgi:zinc protease
MRRAIILLLAGCASAPEPHRVAEANAAAKQQAQAPAPVAAPAPIGDPWAGAQLISAPPAEAPQPVKVRGLSRFTLRNGLEVVVVSAHEVPTVDLTLVVRAGGLDESPSEQGSASYTGQMLRKGTVKRSAAEISKTIDSVGGTLGVDAGEETTSAHCGALSRNLATCIDLLADISLHPTFPPEAMGEVRDRLIAAVEQVRDSKDALAEAHFDNLLFGEKHPRGLITTAQDIAAIKAPALAAFHKKYFVAQNAVLAVAGDVDATKLKAQLDKAFGGLARGKKNVRKEPALASHSGIEALLVDRSDLSQTRIVFGGPGVRHRDPDFFAVLVANYTLGGGAFSSRLMQRIRSKGGKTYGISSRFEANEWLGAFAVAASVPNEYAQATVDEVREEMRAMREKGPTDEEIAAAKAHMAGSYVLRVQTPAQLVGALVAAELHGLGIDYVENWPLKVAAVTPAEVRAAAAKHFDPENGVLVLVGKGEAVAPQLAKANLKAEVASYLAPISSSQRKKEGAAAAAVANAPAADVARARVILGDALKAAGGADKLKAIKDATVSAKMKVTMGGQAQEMAIKQYTLMPDNHRIDTSVMGQTVKLVITSKGAFQQMGPRVIDLPPDQAASARKQQVQRGVVPTEVLVRAADPATKVRARDSVEKNGRKMDVVEMIDRDGQTTTLWIDAATHLLARAGDADQGAEFDEWKDVSGLKYPFKINLKGRQTIEISADEVKINSGVSPDVFKHP